ncbi:MAG: helix-turn-helix domain-containing protein [Chloroflexota bacterium]|nr:helix-turn-helix domain-containing protein [Chloroflexota bacterium]
MPRVNRSRLRLEAVIVGRRLARTVVAKLGQQVREARLRRKWSQRHLAAKVGLSRSRIAQLEAGGGGGVPPWTWFALSHALELPLRLDFARDAHEQPADAGHLAMQELLLRLGRHLGVTRTFELPTRPSDPTRSVDVCWRDDSRRALILIECWNSFGSINESVRSTRRKIAEAEQLAVAVGGDRPRYRIAACWVVRDTRRNRELLARYPEVFTNAFPSSSRAWVNALTVADSPIPDSMGLVWSDARSTRLFAWRRAPAAGTSAGSG